MERESVAHQLKARRIARGLTLNDVNMKTGISLVKLSKFELGKEAPDEQSLQLLESLYTSQAIPEADPRFLRQLIEEVPSQSSAVSASRRRVKGRSWDQDDPLLLDLVLQKIKSGDKIVHAFQEFGARTGRKVSSISVHYATSLKLRYKKEIEEAMQLRSTERQPQSDRYKGTKSAGVDPRVIVAYAMSSLTDDECNVVKDWVLSQFPRNFPDVTILKRAKLKIEMNL